MDNFEIARETAYIFFEEEGITVEKAFEKAKKRCLGVDQNNQSTHEITFKDILPPGVDLGNNQVYLEETGETVGNIEEVFKCK